MTFVKTLGNIFKVQKIIKKEHKRAVRDIARKKKDKKRDGGLN